MDQPYNPGILASKVLAALAVPGVLASVAKLGVVLLWWTEEQANAVCGVLLAVAPVVAGVAAKVDWQGYKAKVEPPEGVQ